MQWDPALECGVELIDNEHKELFNMVGSLMKESSKEMSGETLDFLDEYTAKHFAHEEELMRQCNYPYAVEHKELHDKFINALNNLKEKFEKNDGNQAVRTEIYHAAMSWLFNHIKVIDQRFTDYYKANNN